MSAPATERFSGRVADYARYRPAFPEELLDRLSGRILPASSVVADIGSGTGIFSRQLAARAATVYCVEPNREMREYSAGYLRDLANVRIIDGTAEATGLPAAGVDVVTAAQAFHWFDRGKTKTEFGRILRAGGWTVLLWYERLTTGDAFLEGYERLLQTYSIDYSRVDHRNITPDIIRDFFLPNPFERFECMMTEEMDLAAIRGRIGSSSYTPAGGHPNHAPLMAGVEALFERCERGGKVQFLYRTTAYAGMLPAAGAAAG